MPRHGGWRKTRRCAQKNHKIRQPKVSGSWTRYWRGSWRRPPPLLQEEEELRNRIALQLPGTSATPATPTRLLRHSFSAEGLIPFLYLKPRQDGIPSRPLPYNSLTKEPTMRKGTGDDKEDVNSVEAAGKKFRPDVINNDQPDRHGPEPLDIRSERLSINPGGCYSEVPSLKRSTSSSGQTHSLFRVGLHHLFPAKASCAE